MKAAEREHTERPATAGTVRFSPGKYPELEPQSRRKFVVRTPAAASSMAQMPADNVSRPASPERSSGLDLSGRVQGGGGDGGGGEEDDDDHGTYEPEQEQEQEEEEPEFVEEFVEEQQIYRPAGRYHEVLRCLAQPLADRGPSCGWHAQI